MASLSTRIDAFQRQHPAAGFPLAVVYKFVDDQGSYLAALMTYYAFLSLTPLLLLASTILGYVLHAHPDLEKQVLGSALTQFPVIGKQLKAPGGLRGSVPGVVIGSLGALFGGLGFAQAVQNAMNTAWAIPKNSRPNPFKARARSLLLLGIIGLSVIGTTVCNQLGSYAVKGFLASAGVFLGCAVVNGVVFVLGFRIATARDLSLGQVAPGALAAALVWQLLQKFGGPYVDHVVKHASETNATFATVLGLLAFLYIACLAAVLSAEVDVVRDNGLYPRSLLTPFTDNVQLTPGDQAAYTSYAKAQRNKGFEQVDVVFHGQEASPDDRPRSGGPGGS